MERVDFDKIIQENIILKSDNLLFKEDINHLSEINKTLSNELNAAKQQILTLINQNASYQKEIANKLATINQLNETIDKMNIVSSQKSTTIGRQIKQNLEEKIYYLNKNNKELNNELVKANTENKVLKEQIEELKKDNDKYKKYHDISASKEKEQMSILEDKFLFMENQLNNISKENNELRIMDDKNRKEIEILQKEKEKIQNKYEKKKEEYNQLVLKYNQLDKQAKEYQLTKISIFPKKLVASTILSPKEEESFIFMTIAFACFPNFSIQPFNFLAFVPAKITEHPLSINFFAIAIPIPPEPPVIRATFPSNNLSASFTATIGIFFSHLSIDTSIINTFFILFFIYILDIYNSHIHSTN